jgi:hypothetical protein
MIFKPTRNKEPTEMNIAFGSEFCIIFIKESRYNTNTRKALLLLENIRMKKHCQSPSPLDGYCMYILSG